MTLIDTHAHLYLPTFDEDREPVINRALEAGIEKIFLPNINRDTIGPMHSLCDAFPETCFPMMGLHPCDVKEGFREVLTSMRTLFSQQNYIAVGETGIDLYWDKTTLEAQRESFRIQIGWAREMGLPVVIHARDSFDEIFAVLDEEADEKLRGVFHCFTGNRVQAEKILSYSTFMMGLGGVLTYEKANLGEVVERIPRAFIVLETDSPYLSPKPMRSSRNESARTRIVAEALAAVWKTDLQEVSEVTTQNALRMFMPEKTQRP